MFLALDVNNYGINSFSQFVGLVLPLLLFLLVCLFIYILPAKIIADAIKKNNSISNFLGIDAEYDDSYRLHSGIVVYKKWYDKENDIYISPYGFYIPVYNNNKDIVSFMYEKK